MGGVDYLRSKTMPLARVDLIKGKSTEAGRTNARKPNMKQTHAIPETFLGVGYTRERAGLPLEAVRRPVPRPAADEVLIRVAASSLNPLEYKLANAPPPSWSRSFRRRRRRGPRRARRGCR